MFRNANIARTLGGNQVHFFFAIKQKKAHSVQCVSIAVEGEGDEVNTNWHNIRHLQ